MLSPTFPSIYHLLMMVVCCPGITAMSQSVSAAELPSTEVRPLTQTGRYSVMSVAPSAGQREPLSVTADIIIPDNIERIGDAIRWLLRDSGYRLAADRVLTQEAKAMLELPLPSVHRHFTPLPLTTVIALMVGPSFYPVQDPVHRLIAFEQCDTGSDQTPIGGAL